MNEREVFIEARQITSAEHRVQYLDGACAGDVDLRRRIDRLLQADGDAGSFLASPVAAGYFPTVTERPLTEGPGTVIGPYKLLEQIGEGGFGVVFMAEQTAPVKRKVALKVIKPGMDTRQVIARFEAERQALALMDHPHIAKVLDAGATATGRPFFVMELVKGVPITEYCDQHQLPPRERLELFVAVCHAVQHAHQKGIIHRDIKPSNVLVSLHDDQPVVKVIDFGIAKATSVQLTDKTLFTGFSQLVGTPLYMSPEQAALNAIDVDTRSDVYSLGVLLYELLTGTTPFDKQRLQGAAFDEVRRIIREEEPQKPSARISTLRNAETALAAPRPVHRKQPGPVVVGELDWIVMKALEKDRNRRYGSANALAGDVERHLRHEPVQACPPSNWYRFRKLARRNRTACVATAAAVLVVLLGTAALAVSNYLIRQEQARTREEQQRTAQALRLAEQRAAEVRQQLERLKQANTLLERGGWYSNLRRWDDAHAALTRAVELRPDHVSAWVARADLYIRLGLWDRAAADYRREFELREPNTAFRWLQYALLLDVTGDEEGCRQTARAMRRRFAGTPESAFVEEMVRCSLLVADPDTDMLQLIELARKEAPVRPVTLYFVLGHAQYRAGLFDEAVVTLTDALARPHAPIGEASLPVLAMAQYRLGHDAEARQALDEAARNLDRWTQARYDGDGGTWVVDHGADGFWPVGWWDYLECQILYQEARLLIDGVPPPDDPRLHVLHARALAGLNWFDQSIVEYDAAVKLSPLDVPIRAESHRNRGSFFVDRGQWAEAAAAFTQAAELQADDAGLWRYQAVAEVAAGDFDAYRQTCAAMLERFAQTHDHATAGNVLLVCVLRDDAIPDMGRLLPLTPFILGHWGEWSRGAALYRAGRYQESVECFEASTKMYRPKALEWCFSAMAQHRLGHAAEALRCLEEARCWIDSANQATGDDFSATRPVWGGWDERIVYPLLLQEAQALIEPGGSESHDTKAEPASNSVTHHNN